MQLIAAQVLLNKTWTPLAMYRHYHYHQNVFQTFGMIYRIFVPNTFLLLRALQITKPTKSFPHIRYIICRLLSNFVGTQINMLRNLPI